MKIKKIDAFLNEVHKWQRDALPQYKLNFKPTLTRSNASYWSTLISKGKKEYDIRLSLVFIGKGINDGIDFRLNLGNSDKSFYTVSVEYEYKVKYSEQLRNNIYFEIELIKNYINQQILPRYHKLWFEEMKEEIIRKDGNK